METFLGEIENLHIFSRRQSAKEGAGIHKGGGRGVSLDFYGHSPYSPGEDLRKIDWKAYARTEHLYIKDFSEERQMPVTLVLDRSASMDFGFPGKWEISRTLALGLAFLTLRQGDRLNFYLLNHELAPVCENLSGREGFYGLTARTEGLKPEGKTRLAALAGLGASSRGMTFLISDLLAPEREKMGDLLSAGGRETVIFHLLSPWELNPREDGEWKMVDKETGRVRSIHLHRAVRERYVRGMGKFLHQTEALCAARNIRYIFASTEERPSVILARGLEVGS